MKTRILKALAVSLLLCGILPAQDTPDLEHKSLKGEFVIRDTIQDLEVAKKYYPVTSPFAGKMFVVKLEFVGEAPQWFGHNPRWIQSLEFPGEIKTGAKFKGEVHYEPKFGFHFGCFNPVQFYLKEAEQAGAGQPATRSESDSEGGDNPQPESEERSR